MPLVHRHSRRLRRRAFWLLTLATLLAIGRGAAAQGAATASGLGTPAEYVVGFVQYVRWPGDDEIRSWEVCVPAQADDDRGAYAGRTVRGRPVAVRRLAAGDALASCQVLDLTGVANADAKSYLERARKLAILTVGTGEGFCSVGGTVCLLAHDGATGFEVNLSAAQQARLALSAHLLKLSRKRQVAGAKP